MRSKESGAVCFYFTITVLSHLYQQHMILIPPDTLPLSSKISVQIQPCLCTQILSHALLGKELGERKEAYSHP